MSPEIYWLGWTSVLTTLLFIPYAYNRISKITLLGAMRRALPGDEPFDEAWGHRAYRAHMNAFEDLITFAPLAIAVHVAGMGNEVTAMAVQVHFFARLLHAPIYWFNVPWLRFTSYMVGLITTLILAWQLLV